MALRQIGTTTTTALRCIPAWSQVVSQADIAAVAAGIVGDDAFAALLSGYGAGADAVLSTGTTHTNTTLDTLVTTGGAPLNQIKVGDVVLKADVAPGTFVARLISATSVQLSQAATGSANGRTAFVRFYDAMQPEISPEGLLTIPRRGVLKVLPGDFVCVDPATGWPILVSANAVGYAGSLWNLV